jgi:phosphoribosylformylglycinamidine cyclo-ligase
MPRAPIFDLLIEAGELQRDEAYRVFNMGFGMILMVAAEDADRACADLAAAGEPARRVGAVVAGDREVRLE